MSVDQLKMYLSVGILIGEVVAPRTNTKIDDKAVEVAKKIQSNDALLALIAQLFSGVTINVAEDQKAAFAEVEPHLDGVKALVEAAKAVC
jgi:xanthosine utilization system XapX-like protein